MFRKLVQFTRSFVARLFRTSKEQPPRVVPSTVTGYAMLPDAPHRRLRRRGKYHGPGPRSKVKCERKKTSTQRPAAAKRAKLKRRRAGVGP